MEGSMTRIRTRLEYPDGYVTLKRDPTPDEIRLIKSYGKTYKSASLPGDIMPGTLGQCFDWSMMQALKAGRKYQYVEGIAKVPRGNWELHAWLSDGRSAFDPTWHGTAGGAAKYIGIEIPMDVLLQFNRQTEYQGMICNRWRAPELWDAFVATLRRRR
jgi:hypothetical protein